MEQNRESIYRDIHIMVSWFSTKVQSHLSETKIVFSTMSARTIGYLMQQNELWSLPCTTYNS